MNETEEAGKELASGSLYTLYIIIGRVKLIYNRKKQEKLMQIQNYFVSLQYYLKFNLLIL